MQEDQFKQDERFWLLVSLQLSGEATPEELAELAVLLQERPGMGMRMEALHGLWKGAGEPEKWMGAGQQEKWRGDGQQEKRTDALNRHLQRLSNHLSSPALKYETAPVVVEEEEVVMELRTHHWTRRLFWPLAGVAAAAAAIFFFTGRHASPVQEQRIAQNTVSTKPGSKSKIQLPDGSQVWLNGDSRITYDENFRGPFREVQITGEAYFDIAKDKDHPFIIHANSIDVKILGTSLNVRSYSNEKNTEAVLIRGSIEVTLHGSPDKKIILQPNEKLVVQNGKSLVRQEVAARRKEPDVPVMTLGKAHLQPKDSTAMAILWIKNKLAFDQEPLEDVARKLERWYDVKVTIKDERLKHMAYTAVFEDESLRQVMEALRITGNFRYSIGKKEVTITP